MFKKFTPTLVRAMSVFVITVIVSLVMVSVSSFYMDETEQDEQSAKRAMRIWQKKINSSVENNQIIDEFETKFLKLVKQGVVGNEDRLSWFETIQNTAKKRGMPLVKYSVSSQKHLGLENIQSRFSGIDVYKSVLTLDIKMAHEGDLFALLNDLSQADGLYAVDKCNIEKIGGKKVDTENNMKAFCELGWYTFRGTKSNKGNKHAG